MTPELIASVGGFVATCLVALLAWSMRRNVRDIDDKVGRIETDVRTLSSQGARHGESLAAGVQQFKAVEKRLDGLEERERIRDKECSECQRRWAEGVRG